MLYLIWSLLNVVLFIYFLYLFFGFIAEGRKIFNSKLKPVAVLVLGFGIIQLFRPNTEVKKNNKIIFHEFEHNYKGSSLKTITLEDNMSYKILMDLKYQNDTLLSANSNLIGLNAGHNWEFNSVNLYEEKHYEVHGSLAWTLFGLEIIKEPIVYKGIIK